MAFIDVLFHLSNYHHIVFPVLFGTLRTGGVPQITIINDITLDFGHIIIVFTPFAGISEWTFVNFAVDVAA